MSKPKQMNTMLVCLDLTEIDQYLIEYASFLSHFAGVEKVIFLHAIQAYDLPDKSSKKFPDIQTELRGKIEGKINEVISGHFKEKTKIEVVTKIEEEDAADMVINFVSEKGVDITLIGQKLGEDRSGHYARKITAQALTNLMFIPENPELTLGKILCGIDLSKSSEKAFRLSLDLSKEVNGELICHYLYNIGKSYFPVTTFRGHSALEKRIRRKFRKYLAKFDLKPGDVQFNVDVNDEITSQADKVYEKAEEVEAHLVIIGAKGRTSVVTSLLGNIAEKLRRMEKQIPVMIVKNTKK